MVIPCCRFGGRRLNSQDMTPAKLMRGAGATPVDVPTIGLMTSMEWDADCR
jgi:hypothetical protein